MRAVALKPTWESPQWPGTSVVDIHTSAFMNGQWARVSEN